ncbi:nuclear mitotic apparatus protein 1-like [Varroa jacobsoni]|nr:nuclear mitotic apparatus protein 1-like [Varroa jacobsoni]
MDYEAIHPLKETTSHRYDEASRLQEDSRTREEVVLEVTPAAGGGTSRIGVARDGNYTGCDSGVKEIFHVPLSEGSSLSEDSASRWCSEIQGLREHINTLQRQLNAQKELSERLLREKARMLEQVAELRDEKRRLEDSAIHRSREQQMHIETLSMRCEQLQDERGSERKERLDGQIIGSLKAELEKLGDEVRQLSEENLHLKNKTILTRHDWQNIVQKRSSETRRHELEKLQLQEQAEDARADSVAMHREVDHLQGRLLQLTKELTASKEDGQKERAKAEAAQQASAHLEKEIDKIRLFYEEQAQDNRTCHQKAIEELKSGYEAQISELRTRFKSTADEYNSRLKHEMFPVLDEFQRLNIAVVEAEAEVASLRGLLEREKTECDRRHETERTLREQIASLSSDLSERREKCEELLGQLGEIQASHGAQLVTLANTQRAAVALKTECDRQRRSAEKSAAERAELERELLTLREAKNQNDTVIQNECSHMQERIVVLLREKEGLSTELTETRDEGEVLRGRITLLEMQLEEHRKRLVDEGEAREKESQRMAELKEQLNSARAELDIYREKMGKLEWQRTELLECRERLRRLDSALLPLTQQASCVPEAVEEAVARLTDELETLRGRLGSTEHQLTNVRTLSLSESLRNFEDSKKATELQRELTVKDARINALEQRLLRLQTEIELERQSEETRFTEGLPLQQHNKVLMHAELSKASTSLKLMEEKYEEEMENERQANQRLREQMEQLRDDCESLRRALQKTQDEVEGLRQVQPIAKITQRGSPVRGSSMEQQDLSNSRALIVGCSHNVGGGHHDSKEHHTREKNYEQLYRRLKHDYNNLRQKLETLRRLHKDAAYKQFTANNVLLNELSRSLHNVSVDPECMPEETQALCVIVEAFRAPRHQEAGSQQQPTQHETSTRIIPKCHRKKLEFGDHS